MYGLGYILKDPNPIKTTEILLCSLIHLFFFFFFKKGKKRNLYYVRKFARVNTRKFICKQESGENEALLKLQIKQGGKRIAEAKPFIYNKQRLPYLQIM